MKPSLRRLQEKYGQKQMDPTMSVYASAVQRIVDAKGEGKSYRDDRRPLNIKIKPISVLIPNSLFRNEHHLTSGAFY